MPRSKEQAPTFHISLLFLYRLFYFAMLAFLLGITVHFLVSLGGILGFLLFFVFVFVICVTVHELGHVLGALAGKLRISLFSVGFIKIVRTKNRWVLRISKNFLFNGTTLAAPLDDHDLDRRLLLWTLGGPLIGFLYGLLCFLLYFLLPAGWVEPSGLLSIEEFLLIQIWLISNGLFSILISFHSLIPDIDTTSTSDGFKILQYLKGGNYADALKNLYLISGAAQSGIRPREWNPAYLDNLIHSSSSSNNMIQVLLYKYLHELDLGKIEQAGRSLDQALLLGRGEKLSGADLFWEAAYYTARFRKQPDLARQWLQRGQPGFLDEEQTRVRAEAAILIAEGKFREALSRIELGFQVLKASFESGIAQAEKDWLNELADQARMETAGSDEILITKHEKAEETDHLLKEGNDYGKISPPGNFSERSTKKRNFSIKSPDQIWRPLLVNLVPVLFFCCLLITFYFLMGKESCSQKILDDFACKSKYNFALIESLSAEKQGDHSRALQALSNALNVHPAGVFARNFRAHLLTDMGMYPSAIRDFSLLLSNPEADPYLYLERADVLKRMGLHDQAAYDTITAMNMGSESVYRDGVLFLHQMFKQIDDLENWVTTLESQQKNIPSSAVEACGLGLVYTYLQDQGKLEYWEKQFFDTYPDETIFCMQVIEDLKTLGNE